MAEQDQAFGRLGHAGDLHEWAKRQEAQRAEAIHARMEVAKQTVKALVSNVLGENFSQDLATQLDEQLTELETASYYAGQLASNSQLLAVFDGDAMNA